MNRSLLIVVCFAFALGCAAPKECPPADGQARVLPDKPGAKNVGILVYDNLFITEMSGPLDAYHHVPADKINVFTVAPTMDKIVTYEHLVIQPDFSFANAPKIDVLVVPSGNSNLNATYDGPGPDLDNTALINFVKTRAATAEKVTSHCWGAFILAKAGLLDGKKATTFPGYEQVLQKTFPNVQVQTTARWIEDGNTISSNGGIAAYEASTHVAIEEFGDTVTTTIQKGLVMSPDNIKYVSTPTY